ncbi:dapper homolog 3-like [Panthera uncia]|uniref:dapper homolog 3-like n=1 Tax=Panthera uncia TaxID=29064 RepID=UPI0020FFCE3D|nr:dapper homolog 3-like [Panthera uncia]
MDPVITPPAKLQASLSRRITEKSRIPKEPGRNEPGAGAAEKRPHTASYDGGAAPSAIRAGRSGNSFTESPPLAQVTKFLRVLRGTPQKPPRIHLSRGGLLQEDNPGHRASTAGNWGWETLPHRPRPRPQVAHQIPQPRAPRERGGRRGGAARWGRPSTSPPPLRAPEPAPAAQSQPGARAPPPAPAGRERPPDTHLGRSGSWGPSRATRPRSRCGRQRAHAASTAAGRTRRHCPCCGESARGLPRPHRAGALPAAPFRLRRTILRSLRARPGAADLSQLAFAAQLSNIHLWGFSLAAPFHEPKKKKKKKSLLGGPRVSQESELGSGREKSS